MMINTQELQKIGYTKEKSNSIMQMMGSSLPTTSTNVVTIDVRNGKEYHMRRSLRNVKIEDAIQLCDERIANIHNSVRVDIALWGELKVKLENI